MQEDYSALYRELHSRSKAFQGKSIRPSVPHIARLVELTKPRRLLDYGCGKGLQYSEYKVQQAWGGMKPYCYDVGVERYANRPNGAFHGVICTDVLEHIAEADVPAILDDIFGFLPERRDGGTSFAFFYVACRPAARKTLPDGRNVHLTVKPPAWWEGQFEKYKRDKLIIESRFDEQGMEATEHAD
jgi:hypothetical protein